MDLNRAAREYYVQEIRTDPDVTGWEASFDEGTTWTEGEAVPSQSSWWRWLVHGPTFNPAGAPAAESTEITDYLYPLLRAIDTPEVLVTRGTLISLID